MFKKTVMASLVLTALAGCSSIPGMESATVDRVEMSNQLTQDCKDLGKDYTEVSVAVDKASKVMVSIQERQCSVFNDYRTLASKHADVAGFLAANADKSDEELRQAMDEFDMGKPENKTIRPQVEAYQKASDSIFDKNVELAIDITKETGELALIASNNAQALAVESAGAGLENLLAWIFNEQKEEGAEEDKVPVVEAYREMEARMYLAKNANDLITLDKNTIKQLENLDAVLEEKVKG